MLSHLSTARSVVDFVREILCLNITLIRKR
jgi:hypothetical protein